MDLIDIAYHLSRQSLTNEDYNEITNLVKESGKDYLFNQSFEDVKAEIFQVLKNIKEH